jgi:hypothetical protein
MSWALLSLLTKVTRPPWRMVTVEGDTVPELEIVMVAESGVLPPPLGGGVGEVGESLPPPHATPRPSTIAVITPHAHRLIASVITPLPGRQDRSCPRQ